MNFREVARTGFEAYRAHRAVRGDRRAYGPLGQARTREQDVVYRFRRRFRRTLER
ncbi:hypothetical protein [Truepera radiovictrix]|uniref:Indolepyruvate ferredoxin oxidoreductase n=1 Tax=Truepera radiovictrix (strain DSM 17093 / CIP 108686 / LMG 22925 / RQ-24) TaxID=649638 RepID=D7CTT0_TRURR|nr:hypothetical protein [Truepera radiovictrix]ADI15627.1 indolepyruvate ferredoxin oxidoreductase [Truepera radiovictrix DSM 17093]WMT58743.1 hypothetical protein RCV51_07300 [Truepera radiovictrix]